MKDNNKTNSVKHIGGKTFLNGTTSIRKQRIIYYEDETKKIEETDYPLIEISTNECFIKRINSVPGFLLKNDGHLFFAELPSSGISLGNFELGEHLCINCKHCSAASDENGGCAKVRDRFPKGYGYTEKDRWSKSNCMIEKYSFITFGYEIFNCSDEALLVTNCLHFEEPDPRKIYSRKEIEQMKLGIAQYLVPEATTLAEARRIIARDSLGGLFQTIFSSK